MTLTWQRLPTAATLIVPPHNRRHRENRKLLLAAGFTTGNGTYYKHPRRAYVDARKLTADLQAGELMTMPSGSGFEIDESADGDELYVLLQSVDPPKDHFAERDDETPMKVVVNLDAAAGGLPAEAADAPKPTVASARAMLLECGFKEVMAGEFRVAPVGNFEREFALRSVGAGTPQLIEKPPEGQSGTVIWGASNAELGIVVRMRYEVEFRPANAKPHGPSPCREMTVTFGNPPPTP